MRERLGFFNIHLSQNIKHMKGGPFGKKISKKVSQCRKKTKMTDPLGFFNIHSVAKLQKMKGGPLGNFFVKTSHSTEKKLKGVTL